MGPNYLGWTSVLFEVTYMYTHFGVRMDGGHAVGSNPRLIDKTIRFFPTFPKVFVDLLLGEKSLASTTGRLMLSV